MTELAVQSLSPTTRHSSDEISDCPVPNSPWRGILLVEPDVSILAAEALLLTRSNYCVTSAFSQGEVFTLRETKSIALAIISDRLGPRLLTGVAGTVRKQWPLARILVLGRAESMLEDHLYDEQIDRCLDPKQLLEDLERLYKGSWNQRLHTLEWDVTRSSTYAARSSQRERDPSSAPAVAAIEHSKPRGAYELAVATVNPIAGTLGRRYRHDAGGVPKGSDLGPR